MESPPAMAYGWRGRVFTRSHKGQLKPPAAGAADAATVPAKRTGPASRRDRPGILLAVASRMRRRRRQSSRASAWKKLALAAAIVVGVAVLAGGAATAWVVDVY